MSPDITKCENQDCKLKDRCYRFIAKPDEFCQAYFLGEIGKDGECEYFWKTIPSEKPFIFGK